MDSPPGYCELGVQPRGNSIEVFSLFIEERPSAQRSERGSVQAGNGVSP